MDAAEIARHVARIEGKLGGERGPFVVKIEAGAIMKFAEAIGETNRLYLDEDYAKGTRFGALVAPPTFVSYFSTRLTEELFDLDFPGLRSLHTDDITENHLPILAGDTISAMGRLAEVYTVEARRGTMIVQAVDTSLTNQNGQLVAVVRMLACSFE